MSLEGDIRAWDAKSLWHITEVFKQHSKSAGFTKTLIELTKQKDLQKGTTWLLKKYLETGQVLNPQEEEQLFKLSLSLEHWESQLHALQCLSYMTIHAKQKQQLESFLRKSLKSQNKFVRAWAYSGFYELASQHNDYQKEATKLLKYASENEAASIKARVRNIRIKLGDEDV